MEGEFALGEISRVGFAEHGVAVARKDLAGFEGRPEVFCYRFVTEVASDCFLAFENPIERLLICSARH